MQFTYLGADPLELVGYGLVEPGGVVDVTHPALIAGVRARDDFAVTDLSKATVDQLRQYAEAQGIDLGDAKKKSEILAIVKGA